MLGQPFKPQTLKPKLALNIQSNSDKDKNNPENNHKKWMVTLLITTTKEKVRRQVQNSAKCAAWSSC